MKRETKESGDALLPDGIGILGLRVSAVDLAAVASRVSQWIEAGETRNVSVANGHAVMDARQLPEVRAAFARADLVVPDGMSMVWLLRLAGRRGVGRVYGPDLMRRLCALSVKRDWSHFLLGGTDRVNEALAIRLKETFPGLRIAGRFAPPFRALTAEEQQDVLDRINASAADLVWVGLGEPKQELWMAANQHRLRKGVLIGVGAAFDYLSGRRRQAPRWVQVSGFEWLFRLAAEPRRLWPRYRRYPLFVLLALGWLVQIRRQR